MHFTFPFFDGIGAIFLICFFIFLFIMETFFQLRKRTQSRFSRIVTNAGVASIGFLTLRLTLIPVLVWMATFAEINKLGILYFFDLPAWLTVVGAFLFLDYFNYIWHVLNHHVPFLWRFHNVHHTDLDLDVTTAVRFHFGEVLASVVFRGIAVLLVGAGPLTVLFYEIIYEAATNFHHSNWRLNKNIEQFLQLFIVTPRMHGVHHSIKLQETNSNYSVIFSFWDRLHKTLRLHIPQEQIVIGVPSYRDPKELTFLELLKLPFKKQKTFENLNEEES